MLFPTPPLRKRSGPIKSKPNAAPPGPVALTVVSASFDSGSLFLTVTFDRDIDINAIAPGQIQVNDAVSSGGLYTGNGDGGGAGGATLTLYMDLVGEATGTQVLLNATAETGIVAVDDGGAWAGVTDLVLPFP